MAEENQVLNIQYLGAGRIRELVGSGWDTILIPIGSCERHGNPHTPLGLDGLVTLDVVERAAAKAGVLHAPLVPFGYTPHHMGRVGEGCGTVSLRVETYRSLLEDIGRSLIFHGFNKLIFVSFHSFNVTNAEEVLFSLRFKTGAVAAFYGGRESDAAARILESPPGRLASDFEAATAMALLGDRFDPERYLAHGYEIHAPAWLGPAFTKRPGTGMAVRFRDDENIFIGMDDFEFARPVVHGEPLPSAATAAKGRRLLDAQAEDLAAFAREFAALRVEATDRSFPQRAR